ncbi:MAG: Glutathione-regulated potassium-efflux system protein KefC [Rhodospirillaceae bacterium]|nr:MAG: Glutathione-regulated potassium-efflux system protein KefC [Rhodospirillaceae bacterium]
MTTSFLFLATLFLGAAVIIVPLFQRRGLGSVLGYLVAGVAIAPVLRWLGADAVQISHIAEFGVVMMLFLVGLELEPKKLWRLRVPIIGIGGAQALVTAAAMWGLGQVFGLDWRMALALGLALALSSTAIVLQTLNEKGQMATPAGQNSFSVLLFQDIAVIPILAVLPFLAHPGGFGLAGGEGHSGSSGAGHDAGGHDASGHGAGGHGGEEAIFDLTQNLSAWGQAGVSIGVIIAIIFGGRYAIRPLFRVIARTHIRELFTAVALLIVVGIAFLMGAIGLSAALGTFIAGVVLADSEYRHELESDIEPFKGLLLGLFFITVGAQINFNTLFGEPLVIFGLLAGLVVLKAVIIFGLATVVRLDLSSRFTMALLLAQGGEFAFVLFGFMIAEDVLPRELTDRFTLVVALSMLLTPMLVIFNERVLQPASQSRSNPSADDVYDEGNPVIVAGFGRMGTIIIRMLQGLGVSATVLDHDPDQIDLMRRFGHRAFYGDASRLELLESAGAGSARVLIVAIDNSDKTLEIVELARRHFPHLRIVARARERRDAMTLLKAGADEVVRETFEGAVQMSQRALEFLGTRPFAARQAAQRFETYDIALMRDWARMEEQGIGEKERIERVRQATEDLANLLVEDQKSGQGGRPEGWQGSGNADER